MLNIGVEISCTIDFILHFVLLNHVILLVETNLVIGRVGSGSGSVGCGSGFGRDILIESLVGRVSSGFLMGGSINKKENQKIK